MTRTSLPMGIFHPHPGPLPHGRGDIYGRRAGTPALQVSSLRERGYLWLAGGDARPTRLSLKGEGIGGNSKIWDLGGPAPGPLYLPAGQNRRLDIAGVIENRLNSGFNPGHRGLQRHTGGAQVVVQRRGNRQKGQVDPAGANGQIV